MGIHLKLAMLVTAVAGLVWGKNVAAKRGKKPTPTTAATASTSTVPKPEVSYLSLIQCSKHLFLPSSCVPTLLSRTNS